MEDVAEQLFAALRQKHFDLLCDQRCRVVVKLEEVLEIPADAFLVVRRQLKRDLGTPALWLKAGNILGADLDAVAVLGGAGMLIDAQYRHTTTLPAANG